MTNERLRHDLGELSLVPPDDRVSGRGTTSIMAAFTHLNPHGTRFSDGTYGVYYAAREIETSIAETRYHTSRFLARTDEEPTEIDTRFYIAELDGDLHDLRGYEETCAAVLNPDDYSASQRLGRLREATSNGPIYPSVRSAGGECVGVFRPILLADCRQERHLTYCWDGTVISGIYEKRDYA
jgi:hypothetical protein